MTDEKSLGYLPDYATSAGDLLAATLQRRGMSQAELAIRTGLSNKHINQILKHGASVSPAIATQLEFVTGVAAEVWAAVDARYQAFNARLRNDERLVDDLAWLDGFDLKELVTRRVVDDASRSVATLNSLLRFFGVSETAAWDRVWLAAGTSFRRSPSFEPNPTATTLWLRSGQRQAAEIDTKPFDAARLAQFATTLPEVTVAEPAVAVAQAKARLAECGVALVLVGEFSGCRASGASWWASPEKAVVMLSNRGKREDRFWFTLCHEIGHVLKHAKRDTFLDHSRADEEDSASEVAWPNVAPDSRFLDDGSRDSDMEGEADRFASESLIPEAFAARLASVSSKADLVELANKIGVAPGVLAGRYQHQTGAFNKYNDLRRSMPVDLFT